MSENTRKHTLPIRLSADEREKSRASFLSDNEPHAMDHTSDQTDLSLRNEDVASMSDSSVSEATVSESSVNHNSSNHNNQDQHNMSEAEGAPVDTPVNTAELVEQNDVRSLLNDAGLRPTKQRLALGGLLFSKGERHVTAEILHEEAVQHDLQVSLATVYNTLHQFTEAGLLRQLAVDGAKTYFDTNTSSHHHFYCEGSGQVMDVPAGEMRISGLPVPPQGMEISRVDVVVRLANKK